MPRASRAKRPAVQFDLEEFDRLLGEFRSISDEQRVKMTFALLRRSSSTDGERYQVAMRHLAKHEFPVIDTGTEFDEELDDAHVTTRLDRHPNALANRNFAAALLKQGSWGRE